MRGRVTVLGGELRWGREHVLIMKSPSPPFFGVFLLWTFVSGFSGLSGTRLRVLNPSTAYE